MQELRYNPLTGEWIIISAATQSRPVQPSKNKCPICPGGAEFPEDKYDLVSFENRYPSLLRNPPEVRDEGEIFKKRKAYGVCEVVVYTSKHDSSLSEMPVSQIEKLVLMWRDRTVDLKKNDFVKYIFIFENRGKEVGASLSHPHGQIYAFSFLPERVKLKIKSFKRWYEIKKTCIICEIVKEELKNKNRVVYENESFIAIVPFYARFPYEVHIYPKSHLSDLTEFGRADIRDFAEILKIVTKKYDELFNEEFPYMMMLFQTPVNDEPLEHCFHFHVEFNPPKRDKDKLKWMASVETGTWAFINPLIPEEAAKRLRGVKVILE